MVLDIRRADGGRTLEISDTIERRRLSLDFSTSVRPSPVDDEQFSAPVSRAVGVVAAAVTIPSEPPVTVRSDAGELVERVDDDRLECHLPPGAYRLSLGTGVEAFLRVETDEGLSISRNEGGTRIEFGVGSEVRIGVRSRYSTPAATITTTSVPRDMMAALSCLGSALQDLGPRRSLPDLRGHPPAIELGDELDLAGLEPPATDVRLELPETYRYVFPAAPLAYYLGAEVVPGDEPRLVVDGTVHDLDGPGGYVETVERTLEQVFLLDCVVRGADEHTRSLARQGEIERATGIDPAALFDESLASQVEAYLSVPYGAVEPYVPRWSATSHVETVPSSVEYLPYLVNDLSMIRPPAAEEVASPSADLGDVDAFAGEEFTRSASSAAGSADPESSRPGPVEPDQPSVSDAGTESPDPVIDPAVSSTMESDGTTPVSNPAAPPLTWPGAASPVVVPEAIDAQQHHWVGQGLPIGADKPALDAYHASEARAPTEGPIEVLVVCNDERAATEAEAVRELLGACPEVDVDLHPHRGLTVEEFRSLLAREADFLHFIGHVDEDGFACADGTLDAHDLDMVNVDTFFLNAYGSYGQGAALVDAGALAGGVTLSAVHDATAVAVGRLLAQLLDQGFPLGAAMELASEEHGGNRYTVLGDGSHQLAAPDTPPRVTTASPASDGVDCRVETYLTPQTPLGSLVTSPFDPTERYLAGTMIEERLDDEAYRSFVERESRPVRRKGSFQKS